MLVKKLNDDDSGPSECRRFRIASCSWALAAVATVHAADSGEAHQRRCRRRSRSWSSSPIEAALKPWIEQGMRFVQRTRRRRRTWARSSPNICRPATCSIDLAWNIDCCEILQWCHDRGVLYINTSVELWDPYAGAGNKHPTERTLYWRHMNLRRMMAGWKEPGPTAVLEHGANPGLISHFTKQALLDIAERALAEQKFAGAQAEKVAHHAKAQEFNHLAHAARRQGHSLQRTRHADHRPAQGSRRVREHLERRRLPRRRHHDRRNGLGHAREGAAARSRYEHADGPKSQICLARMGINTFVRQLGAAEPPHRRHGRPPRRGVHHHREADGVGGRQGRVSPDGALRVLSRATPRSRRSTSCAGSTTSCSRASAS